MPESDRKVWVFCGDGEMDEPESMGALTMPVREQLDNLVFVINCNLQRLDGPVRGNGKIIQELEAAFLGAGWNVIKVIWGSRWDPLLSRDTEGRLRRVMEGCVDGEYQNFKSKGGAYMREHFFGKDPELLEMVANMSDEEIWNLNRGGHDARKVYAAYAAAIQPSGRPTVILAKTVKGFGLGKTAEGQMARISRKSSTTSRCARFAIAQYPDHATPKSAPCRSAGRPRTAGDAVSARAPRGPWRLSAGAQGTAPALTVPPLSAFQAMLDGTGEREISTTMAFVRILTALLKDKSIGPHIVPIVPDEARTFGMEGLFRQIGIYSPVGQLYTPLDAEKLMSYREDKKGQMLEEGINEAGSVCSWIAAATSYANHGMHGAVLHLLLDVRLPARRRFHLGRRRHAARAVSCSAAPPGARRLPARACSTRTGTAICWPPPCPIAEPMTRPTPTSLRSSSRTACSACTATARASFITSR